MDVNFFKSAYLPEKRFFAL